MVLSIQSWSGGPGGLFPLPKVVVGGTWTLDQVIYLVAADQQEQREGCQKPVFFRL